MFHIFLRSPRHGPWEFRGYVRGPSLILTALEALHAQLPIFKISATLRLPNPFKHGAPSRSTPCSCGYTKTPLKNGTQLSGVHAQLQLPRERLAMLLETTTCYLHFARQRWLTNLASALSKQLQDLEKPSAE